MMQDVVINYKTLLENIGELINVSGYRNDYVAKRIGIKPATFSLKKQRATWKADEVEKILSVIENEETEDYFLGLIMKSLEGDETLSLAEFKQQVKWK
jgi:uncharacterized protein YjcR